jgi:hypothetical protein
MPTTFELLLLAAAIGTFDVFYYHLYKFRLYSRPQSVAEEITHLIRAGILVAVVALIMFSDGSPAARNAVLALIGLDVVNSGLDVMLEKKSRADLGGLPSFEYLLHILATFVLGLAAASFWHASSSSGFVPLDGGTWQSLRGIGLLVGGTATLALEGALFARAIAHRRSPAPATA